MSKEYLPIDNYINSTIKAMAINNVSFGVAGFLAHRFDLKTYNVLSIMEEMESRGLAINIGSGHMRLTENGFSLALNLK